MQNSQWTLLVISALCFVACGNDGPSGVTVGVGSDTTRTSRTANPQTGAQQQQPDYHSGAELAAGSSAPFGGTIISGAAGSVSFGGAAGGGGSGTPIPPPTPSLPDPNPMQ